MLYNITINNILSEYQLSTKKKKSKKEIIKESKLWDKLKLSIIERLLSWIYDEFKCFKYVNDILLLKKKE